MRPFESNEDDLNALQQILGEETVNTYLPWFPIKTRTETIAFYQEKIAKRTIFAVSRFFLAVCLKIDNRPIGYVSLSTNENHDFGYGLRSEYWNQGIITEAAEEVLEQLKAQGLDYVTATHDRENIASGQVMKKLGMNYQYSCAENWQPKGKMVTFRMYQLNFKASVETYKKYWDESEEHFIETEL
ncbi:GNAT family N-acetyltransferase [Enterococcus eurekensis]|uniref:GNAT family N-acetyltransferase n=1 Tax=Enterococcus eurekensis TaxID=1159753 RepID=A0ABV9M017_9ENTE